MSRSKEGEARRIASMPKGKNHWNYQKYNVTAIHKWLNHYYGKANRCENKECKNKSNYFEWSLIKGRKYLRKRKNFKMLCRSCHTKYDMTRKRKKKIGQASIIMWKKRKAICKR
jgi:hypothetical protein